MKGLILAVLVWSLVAAPLLFALLRAPKQMFLGFSAAAGLLALLLWSAAGFGYRITENMTTSLQGHIYLLKVGAPFKRGDLIAYRWQGGATYPPGTIFIKPVVGMPGDVVRTDGRMFWVGDRYIGFAKPVSRTGTPLPAAGGGVIPEGEYFVATTHPDSLDSRYALAGNVKAEQILGRAYEVF